MINEETTEVYVRVDLPTNRVIGVSDQVLITRAGRPVFKVASNQSRLDYYVIEKAPDSPHGITVRAATLEERVGIDQVREAQNSKALAQAKFRKAIQIKDFFDNMFIRRFYARGFYSTLETMAASEYDGTDEHMVLNVVPKAKKIIAAYNEWRHVVCQPVIEAMNSDPGLGQELSDEYRSEMQDLLDTFLTERDFDVNIYHR